MMKKTLSLVKRTPQFAIAVVGLILTILWAPNIGEWFARLFTNAIDGGNEERQRTMQGCLMTTRRTFNILISSCQTHEGPRIQRGPSCEIFNNR